MNASKITIEIFEVARKFKHCYTARVNDYVSLKIKGVLFDLKARYRGEGTDYEGGQD